MDWSPALAHLRRVDPRFAPLIDRHGAPPLVATRAPLESLGRAIVYQQLSGAAAGTIYRRFLGLYGKRAAFPSARALAATPVERLRSVGLSAAKAAALLDLAAHVVSRRLVPSRLAAMSEAEVAAALLPVRGIGPWSVDMFLMFAQARPDILPVGDLGVKLGMQHHFRLRKPPPPARMTALARPWQPWRTVGAWYMWRVLESARAGSDTTEA